jgi:hypothetical protein
MRMGKLKMRVADRREPFRLRYGKVEGAALASARHRYRAAATAGERCRYGRRSFNWTQNSASWLDLHHEGRFAARFPK